MVVEQGTYRKRPILIEAFKWDGQPPVEWPKWARESMLIRYEISSLQVDTPNGTVRANRGDWILKQNPADIYPCKAEQFSDIYEKVDDAG